jgi:hypothetical protein
VAHHARVVRHSTTHATKRFSTKIFGHKMQRNTSSNIRSIVLCALACIMLLVRPGEATKWHHGKHWKKNDWRYMEPCSDGWWARVEARKQVNDDNRQVLRCLIHNCGYELKTCAHDWTCRKTTRCLSDCGDDGRECAFACLKQYGVNENVKDLGQCAIANECMRNN